MKTEGVLSSFSSSGSWVILSPIEQSIKQKIEAVGTPLKDWDIQINYGIKTGFNDAFIINTEKRDEILANCRDEAERERTAELIRPILRGRDIKRYSYDWAGLWLIATFPAKHYNIDDYPAVKDFLLTFGIERLEQTGETHTLKSGEKVKARKKTNNKWFETQDSIGYWEDFFKPKIVYQELSQGSSFCIDTEGKYFISNTGYLVTGEHLEWLICLLNSKFIEFCFRKFYSISLGETGLRWLAQYIENLPIIKPKEDILFSQLTGAEIDHKVYELYGLSEEEIAFIENI